jgi:hypothetical protein
VQERERKGRRGRRKRCGKRGDSGEGAGTGGRRGRSRREEQGQWDKNLMALLHETGTEVACVASNGQAWLPPSRAP